MLRNPAERENPFSTDYPPPPLPRPFAAAVKLIEFVSLHGNNFKIPEREMLKALFSLSHSPSPSLPHSSSLRAALAFRTVK